MTVNIGNFNHEGYNPPPPKEDKEAVKAYKEQLRKELNEFTEYAKARREEIQKQKDLS